MNQPCNFALLGHPIVRSISPSLYYYFYPSLPYAGKYYLFSTKYAIDVRSLFEQYQLVGVNVTSPLKRLFLGQLELETPEVRATGALNTITLRDAQLWAHNTDVEGVRHMVDELQIPLKGKRVLVLGAGGAAASVVYVLQQRGAEVFLYNRTMHKAEILAKRFNIEYVDTHHPAIDTCTILFSCLPPRSYVPRLPWRNFTHVLDSTYYSSPVQEYAKGTMASYISGYQWLFYQALSTYEFVMQCDLRGYTYQHWRAYNLRIPLQMEGDPQFDNRLTSSPTVSLIPIGLDTVDTKQILENERQNIL